MTTYSTLRDLRSAVGDGRPSPQLSLLRRQDAVVLLCALSSGPATVSEIVSRVEEDSDGGFGVPVSSAYRLFVDMETAGLVTVTDTVLGARGRPLTVYALTEWGRALSTDYVDRLLMLGVMRSIVPVADRSQIPA